MEPWLTHPRCFLDEPELVSGPFCLSKEEGRHLNRVRRIGVGSSVSVLNGRGQAGLAFLKDVDRDRITIEIEQVFQIDPSSPQLTLVMASLKQSAWDEVLKHAVELGVNRIIRVQTERSVAEVHAAKETRKLHRWRECMIEAIKQSGNPWLPEFVLSTGVESVFDMLDRETIQLLAGLEGDPKPVHAIVEQNAFGSIALWVGPEGDFTPLEKNKILDQGAHLIHLGDRILRAETAAISLLSYLRLRG